MSQEDNNEVEIDKKDIEEIDKKQVKDSSEPLDKDKYIAKLNDDLIEQKKKADEYFEHLKRNMADFDNFKKRITKEKSSMYYTIASDVVSLILPIADDFEKAVKSECKDKKYKEGIEMIYTRLSEALKKMGIEEIDANGKTFDPEFHEAVMHIEDDKYGEKEIVEVLRKGYKIDNKIVRHAMVKVAN